MHGINNGKVIQVCVLRIQVFKDVMLCCWVSSSQCSKGVMILLKCHGPLTCRHSITLWEIWMLSNPTVRTPNLAAWCLAHKGNIALILTITDMDQFERRCAALMMASIKVAFYQGCDVYSLVHCFQSIFYSIMNMTIEGPSEPFTQ
jgi:hypothetical protein